MNGSVGASASRAMLRLLLAKQTKIARPESAPKQGETFVSSEADGLEPRTELVRYNHVGFETILPQACFNIWP